MESSRKRIKVLRMLWVHLQGKPSNPDTLRHGTMNDTDWEQEEVTYRLRLLTEEPCEFASEREW